MNKYAFFLLISTFSYVFAYSQNFSEVKTKLVWIEDHPFFYSEYLSDDYYLYEPHLVSFDEFTDSISVNNYLKGYYILGNVLSVSNLVKDNIDEYLDNIVENYKLMTDFYKVKDKQKVIRLNKVWIYSLAIVTYQDLYLGRFKRLVPDFNSSKDLMLKYDEFEIPIYFIKIINIEPYR